jgi:beta-lactamase class C
MKDYFNAMKGKKTSAFRLYKIVGTLALVSIAIVLFLPFFERNEPTAGTVSQRVSVVSRPPNPFVTRLVGEYEEELKKMMERSNTPGAAVAVVRDSTVVFLKGFGLRSAKESDPVDTKTVFRIASVSKCFASFLTGVVQEEGVLNWDDPVAKFVPEFQLKSAEQTQKLNISHVLSHTTGLPYHTYTNMVEEGMELKEMLAMLKDVNLSNDVGEEYSYQNVAYSVIGEVIANATRSTYAEAMKKHVFGPLNMTTASLDYKTIMASNNVAKPHQIRNRKWVPTRINDTYYNVAPAGGINASIDDMSKWMVALLGHRPEVIRKETLQHLFNPAIIARSKNRNYRKYMRPKQSYYGLGWRIIHYPQDTIVYHGGYVTGFRSEVGLNPTEDIAVCILANAPGELADNSIPLFFSLYDKYKKDIKDWEAAYGVSPPRTPL